MKTIKTNCLNCQNDFDAHLKELKRGNGKYCSRKCSHEARVKNLVPKDPNVTCSYCSTRFYLNESKRMASKSGLYFCCRAHKDLAQHKSFNLSEMWPDHYNSSPYDSSDYRALAFTKYEKKCMRCGYDKITDILEVHHKDHDRKNNSIDNLEVLCPNCHCEHHFLSKTGKWRHSDIDQGEML